MKRICESLEVARSNLYARPERGAGQRCSGQRADSGLLALILQILQEHPSYGYRRVHALCNRKLAGSVSHKRIYRLMRQNNLLLLGMQKKTLRQHKGVVATAKSNQRWCSDGFTLNCENGERLCVIFARDCCDREIMAYAVNTSGYTTQMVQAVLAASVRARFGQTRAAHAVQWLTDNGACFKARETVQATIALGLENCFTPVRSPQSNGMAEAFVKTLKRDYAAFAKLPDAECAKKLVGDWIADYNENAPHKGLGMLSPRQFRKMMGNVADASPEPRNIKAWAG